MRLERGARFILSSRQLFCLAASLVLIFALWPTRALRSDNFVFYLPKTHQVLPMEVIEHTKYLPLLAVLNIFGKVQGWSEKPKSARVWFGETQVELRRDEKRIRMNKAWVNLSDPVRVSEGQWVVPVEFLTTVLPRIVHQTVQYQVGSNRIFFGDVKPTTFTVRLDPLSNGVRLTLQFTDKVTVRTAAQNGRWVLYLGENPVEPLEPSYPFHDPHLRELRFDDHDGVPKLILTPADNGLNFYPALAEGGKVLLADVVKPPTAEIAQNAPAQPPPGTIPPTPQATSSIPSGPEEEVPATAPGPPLPLVVLDAAHGGPDTGARSRDGVLEKDLVARVVARIRLTLLESKKFRILLTRSSDSNPTLEQRETAVNLARPVAFLTLHAGPTASDLPHLAVYVYREASSPAELPADQAPQLFVPWTRIQERHLEPSRKLAQILFRHLGQVPGVVPDVPLEVPVRVLRSVDAPAVAIEIGNLSPESDSGALTQAEFQAQVANAISLALREFQGGTS